MKKHAIIIFDGVCNLCNFWVRFLKKYDRKNKFRFVKSQSKEGHKILKDNNLKENPDSVVLITKDGLFERSDAILHAAKFLPFPFKILIVCKIFPKALRDSIYNRVARNRYRWFGVKDSCEIPSGS